MHGKFGAFGNAAAANRAAAGGGGGGGFDADLFGSITTSVLDLGTGIAGAVGSAGTLGTSPAGTPGAQPNAPRRQQGFLPPGPRRGTPGSDKPSAVPWIAGGTVALALIAGTIYLATR